MKHPKTHIKMEIEILKIASITLVVLLCLHVSHQVDLKERKINELYDEIGTASDERLSEIEKEIENMNW